MHAGWLRHVLMIERKAATRNVVGEQVVAWTQVATVRGSIEPLRGREYHEAYQGEHAVSVRLRIRFYRDLVPEIYRVRWIDESGQAHIYEIVSVVHQREQKRQTELMCKELIEYGE